MVCLLENAVRFSPPRTRIEVHAEATGGDFGAVGVEIRVIDHGPGVAPDERDRIIEAFVQGRDRTEGTGLGLATARSFVDAHDGRLDVEQNPARGATFVVDNPERSAP